MLIRHNQPWMPRESEATPEAVFLNRRALLAGAATAGVAMGLGLPRRARADAADPTAGLYPAKRNDAYTIERPVTPESVNTNYNNFYEFGTSKHIAEAAQALKTRPWTVQFDGMVETPRTVGIDDLIKAMTLEERLYRHRCVEAWSMTVPWTGFPLKALVAYAKPTSAAKYITFTTFNDPDMAPGQNSVFYPWPYLEGLTMAEATHDLAFVVTGAYGKPLPNPMGAPLRVALPWKYGFKSAKSIVKVGFTDKRPDTFWAALGADEYGFWANVNPAVPHPRWSQATEEVLGTNTRKPTVIYNGYGDLVAPLYAGLQGEKLFM